MLIRDEFTKHNISRQRRYQLRHIRDGLCLYCHKKSVMGNMCPKHAIKAREHQRKKRGSIKRIRSKSYRLRAA